MTETIQNTNSLVEKLIASRAYGHNPPAAHTKYERQGRDGILQAITNLRREGCTRILVNQDQNNDTKPRPDILVFHPRQGWAQAEVHAYKFTFTVDTTINYRKNLNKDWLEGLPKLVIMVTETYYTRAALRQLEQAGIALQNGLEKGVLYCHSNSIVNATTSESRSNGYNMGNSVVLGCNIGSMDDSSSSCLDGTVWLINGRPPTGPPLSSKLKKNRYWFVLNKMNPVNLLSYRDWCGLSESEQDRRFRICTFNPF